MSNISSNIKKVNSELSSEHIKALIAHHKLEPSGTRGVLLHRLEDFCKEKNIQKLDGDYLVDLNKMEFQPSEPDRDVTIHEPDNSEQGEEQPYYEDGYASQTLHRSSSKSMADLHNISVSEIDQNQPLFTKRRTSLLQFAGNLPKVENGNAREFQNYFWKLEMDANNESNLTDKEKNVCISRNVAPWLLDRIEFELDDGYKYTKEKLLKEFGHSYEKTKRATDNFAPFPNETIKESVIRLFELLKERTSSYKTKPIQEKVDLLNEKFAVIMPTTFYLRFLPLWQMTDETDEVHIKECIRKVSATCKIEKVPELNHTTEELYYCNLINNYVCFLCRQPGHMKRDCPKLKQGVENQNNQENKITERLNKHEEQFKKMESKLDSFEQTLSHMTSDFKKTLINFETTANRMNQSNTTLDQMDQTRTYQSPQQNFPVRPPYQMSQPANFQPPPQNFQRNSQQQTNNFGRSYQSRSNKTCWTCNQWGHTRENCRAFQPNQ